MGFLLQQTRFRAVSRLGLLRAASQLARNNAGIAAIEYALLASLIALTILASVTNLGTEVGNHWDGVAGAVEGGTG